MKPANCCLTGKGRRYPRESILNIQDSEDYPPSRSPSFFIVPELSANDSVSVTSSSQAYVATINLFCLSILALPTSGVTRIINTNCYSRPFRFFSTEAKVDAIDILGNEVGTDTIIRAGGCRFGRGALLYRSVNILHLVTGDLDT
ncbi:unnamed protein product [Caretta caretta]